MKTIKFLLTGFILLLANTLFGQLQVNVSFGSPPPWGPEGYTEVRYYYLPDVEAYYDVSSSMFIYCSAGRWIHRSSLHWRYRSYNLYDGYKVVMPDYRGNTPNIYFTEYKTKYAKGYHGQTQRNIGERPANRNSGGNISRGRNSNRRESMNNKQSSRSADKNMKANNGRSRGNNKKK